MSYPKSLTSWIFCLIGGAFVIFALAVSSSEYAPLLLGADTNKDLSWGPALFRALLFFHGALLIALGFFGKTVFRQGSKEVSAATEKAVEPLQRKTLVFLIVLSVIAVILRSVNLNSDLWVDEVFTLLDFVRQPMGEILTSFPSQNQHMLFSILARISFDIFGESAWALRLPSVLFGVGSIWAMFLLCRKLLGRREGLLASALMTVSYHHIWFSQNARGYMGLLLFTLLATWFWFEALDNDRWSWWLAYAGAIVLGMWVHMTMAFVVASHGLVYLALYLFPKLGGKTGAGETASPERRAGLKPFAAWLLSVTVTAQLYALALPEFLRVGLHEDSRNSLWTNPLWVIRESLQNLSVGFAGIAIVICAGAFVAFGWLSLFAKNRRAAVLMVLPPVFAGSLMLALGHNLFPRFFFFAMGFGLLIVIHGALQLPAFLSRHVGFLKDKKFINAYAGVALALLMIAASLVTVPRNYALPKQNFTGAKSFVENNRSPGEKVVAVSIAGKMYGDYFAPDWSVAETDADLKAIEKKNRDLWLIYTLSPEIKAFHPEMWRMIEKDYRVVQVFPGTLNGGEIFVCQKRNVKEDTNESSRNISQSQNAAVWQTAQNK
ncbi:MAG: glycosyltransferase family 39 protein [Pyrinomonadaceae bacterium]